MKRIIQKIVLLLLFPISWSEGSDSWIHPTLELHTTHLGEFGLFASVAISQNEIIALFGGKIMLKQDALAMDPELRTNVLQIDDNFWIGSKTSEPLDYINHSCNPNTGIKGQIVLVALRDILPNEEITFDYATVVSEWVGMEPIICNCGAPDCRKIIKQDDWENPLLQKKYAGYFSPYIQNKIQKSQDN